MFKFKLHSAFIALFLFVFVGQGMSLPMKHCSAPSTGASPALDVEHHGHHSQLDSKTESGVLISTENPMSNTTDCCGSGNLCFMSGCFAIYFGSEITIKTIRLTRSDLIELLAKPIVKNISSPYRPPIL